MQVTGEKKEQRLSSQRIYDTQRQCYPMQGDNH